MKLIMENWRGLLNENKLRVFDFDDTLVQTDSKIILYKASGETIEQTPGEWAVYKPEKGDEFDFNQFQGSLNNPRELKRYTNILRRVLGAGSDGRRTVILTARQSGAQRGIREYLEDIGIDAAALELITLGSSDPESKSEWIEERIADGYDDIFFIDDSAANIAAVSALEGKYPEVRWRIQQI
jgi:hypothetical protein